MNQQLTKYDAACQALAEAVSFDEVKDILDKAVAMAVYARHANDTALFADATAVQRRAKYRLGQMLDEQKKLIGLAKGTRGQKLTRVTGTAIAEAPVSSVPTLASAGISHKLSASAQKLAKLSPVEFEEVVQHDRDKAAAQAEKAQATAGKKAAKKKKKASHTAKSTLDGCTAKTLEELVGTGQTFGTIYADPPWLYDNQATRASTENHL
jgi:hypothetical protein